MSPWVRSMCQSQVVGCYWSFQNSSSLATHSKLWKTLQLPFMVTPMSLASQGYLLLPVMGTWIPASAAWTSRKEYFPPGKGDGLPAPSCSLLSHINLHLPFPYSSFSCSTIGMAFLPALASNMWSLITCGFGVSTQLWISLTLYLVGSRLLVFCHYNRILETG